MRFIKIGDEQHIENSEGGNAHLALKLNIKTILIMRLSSKQSIRYNFLISISLA